MPERTALVTGAARGIGRAIALDLAAAGHAVAVADVRAGPAQAVAAEIGDSGRRALAVELDVTDRDSVDTALASIGEQLGPVEIAVNNAGWDEMRPFLDTDEAFWSKVIDINYMGVLRVTHAVLPGMIERGWGRFVNIGSDAGRVGSSAEAVYAGTKGAVIAFTKSVAREVARSGITANAVTPGPARTPMLEEMAAAGSERLVEALTRAVPMRRLAEPEDVAAAVTFLASERASYITGQTLSVSGGLTMA